jgi:uncharacterized protein DUF4019
MDRTAKPAILSPFMCTARIAGLLLLLCCLAAVQGCSTTPIAARQPTNAQSTVIQWLTLLDRKDYQATYDTTAAFFKERVSLAQWQAQVSQARSALGDTLSRQAVNASYTNKLTDAPTGDYVVFQFQTEFSGQSRAVETVTVALEGNTWSTVGYFVR